MVVPALQGGCDDEWITCFVLKSESQPEEHQPM